MRLSKVEKIIDSASHHCVNVDGNGGTMPVNAFRCNNLLRANKKKHVVIIVVNRHSSSQCLQAWRQRLWQRSIEIVVCHTTRSNKQHHNNNNNNNNNISDR
jgi:hypothetical protein